MVVCFFAVTLPSYLYKALKLMSTPVVRSPWQQGMRSPLYINCPQFVVAVLLLGCLGIIQVEQFEESAGIEVDSEDFSRIREPSIKSLMADLALHVI